ncbi:pilus (MSHA type) biogenesis protein MshL [Spiribacter vilamensis]|uniref:MSHA biogenesis protein MshL n=1 Tax=Spiribacter vilamensis TaxID=531306 RepID=A0A4Q8D020_9GAMM|nr:pilus (MSHA type) biogenesis protein MshL [Spiribacter vilamensis]RZU98604.1 MSHA biogenesis protein MshL [Spiribacter vilamensis]TVO60137.1 pilus (MSHA type) biogenesis protein MshL [Spiribacter vilamensis]
MRPTRLLLTVGMLAVLTGCTATGGLSQAERDAVITDAMSAEAPEETATGGIPPLPAAADAMLTPEPLNASQGPTLEPPRFDITASDVAVADFYHGLVEDTPYNVIVHPDITGSVSLKLSDVSVPEVMDILREGYGYHYRRTDGSYLVLPSSLETRVFQLNYINVSREGISGTRVAGGEVSSSEEDESASLPGEINGSSLTTRANSNLWTDVENAIQEIVNGQAGETNDVDAPDTGDAARVVTSPEAGSVVVRARPEVLDQVEAFVTNLQRTINRQVVLEARILEVTLSDEFEAGIDWNYMNSSSGEFEVEQTEQDNLPGIFTLDVTPDGPFEATIKALDEQGDVMVLSSPRVSTLNNQKALIKVGTDSFFQTDVELTTETEDGETSTEVDPEFRSFFSGISLDVTPSIDGNGFVTLHVQPSVTDVTETTRSVDRGIGPPAVFELASSDVRQSDSIVRARNGDLIVIGGLMERREQSVDSAVPGIGRIPPFDLLFGRERNVSRKVELVILLRPTIVGDDTWRREIDRQLEQML